MIPRSRWFLVCGAVFGEMDYYNGGFCPGRF